MYDSKAFQKKMFIPFEQELPNETGLRDGTGLGLYICKTIMNKMNGSIYAGVSDNNMVVTVVFAIQ